jgi:asparagine synthase (glutamine-hydrolysing)
MCGIFGIWNINKQPVVRSTLVDSLNSIRHRGPDDEGYLFINSQTRDTFSCVGPDSAAHVNLPRLDEVPASDFDLAFGFRRLSILDLSPAGHQPMSNADGSLWIVYNGEIYNYIELRSELQALGYTFRTQTDTEVILNAYDAWGVDCLNRFNGMWGFALYDSRKSRLFCARDRFGIKPFYYFFRDGRFIFGSEIKALLTDAGIPRIPNDAVIYDYLAYGILDHTEETFYEGVRQLAPAHYMTLEGGNVNIRRYWDIDPFNKFDIGADEKAMQTYAQRFFEIFEDAIRIHLRSDVQIGSCLSGGLDSSAIVSVANRLLLTDNSIPREVIGAHQKIFSSCFEDLRFDERKYITEIVTATSAESHYIFPSPQNLMEELPKLMHHQDEPFGSTSMYAQWCVMKLAGEHGIRVLLDGQGSDEMLAGYVPFFDTFWGTLALRGEFSRLFSEWSAYRRLHSLPLPHFLQYTAFALAPRRFQRQVRRSRGTRVLNPDFIRPYQDRFFDADARHSNTLLTERLYMFTSQTSLPALLRYEDRSSMAHSIESRVPFLDYRLVEYIFSLPAHQIINNGYSKAVLRNAMKGYVPESILKRSDKMGFVTPEKVWFAKELKGWADDIINSRLFRERKYFDYSQVSRTIENYRAGKKDIGFALWRWINLELWLEKNT